MTRVNTSAMQFVLFKCACFPHSASAFAYLRLPLSPVAMTLTLRGLRVGMADTVNFEKIKQIGNFRLITALDVIF